MHIGLSASMQTGGNFYIRFLAGRNNRHFKKIFVSAEFSVVENSTQLASLTGKSVNVTDSQGSF